MSDLFVAAFEEAHKAEKVCLDLLSLEHDHLLCKEIQKSGGKILQTQLEHQNQTKLQAALNAVKK